MNDFILINRDVVNQEWYKDKYTFIVMVHLLIYSNGKANYECKRKSLLKEISIELADFNIALRKLSKLGFVKYSTDKPYNSRQVFLTINILENNFFTLKSK